MVTKKSLHWKKWQRLKHNCVLRDLVTHHILETGFGVGWELADKYWLHSLTWKCLITLWRAQLWHYSLFDIILACRGVAGTFVYIPLHYSSNSPHEESNKLVQNYKDRRIFIFLPLLQKVTVWSHHLKLSCVVDQLNARVQMTVY